ncbi:MAG TPA: type II toxin-antitoxin system VapC family toxin [Mycobacteriales bacterium]|nr:type II toxin-antitoxin system VapC family toxin [Mycobacteriales bacterium]
MSAVLDTTVLVDVLRVRGPAVDYLLGLPTRPVCSEVSRAEIVRGMRADERSATRRLLASVSWQPVDERISEQAGLWGRDYRHSYPGLQTTDLLIAATAEVLGLPLATSNVRHYPMFADLKPPY